MEALKRKLIYSLSKSFSLEEVNLILEQVEQVLEEYKVTPLCKAALPAQIRNVDIIDYYLTSKVAQGCSQETIDCYFSKLKCFCETINKPIIDVTSQDVQNYFIYSEKVQNRSKRTIEHDRMVLSGLYRWLKNEEYILKNPMDKVAKIRYVVTRREGITENHIEQIRYANRNDVKKIALFELLLFTGIRNIEVRNLKLNDIDWERKFIKVMGKGSKERIIPINTRVELALKRYIKEKGITHYVFHRRGDKTRPMTSDGIRYLVDAAKQNADIPRRVRPHDVRHTMASRALRNGMPIEEVKEVLAHESVDTTLIYADIDSEKLKRDVLIYAS